tara:strand:- start:104 stop:595 length:492 start_codon:yes stop_codon:yes gene_type:complete
MPPKYDYTEIENADESIEEIAFMPSTLETIDRAMFGFAEGELDLHVNTNKGWKKVPIIWVSAERSFQIKADKDLRDSTGVLKLPLMTIERTTVEKDPGFKGTFQAHIPDSGGVKRITSSRKDNPARKNIKLPQCLVCSSIRDIRHPLCWPWTTKLSICENRQY